MALLTADEMRTLWRRLTASKEQIDALLNQTSDDVRPVDLDLPIGRLTRIDAIQMQGMAQMNRHQLDVRRRQVDAALDGFTQGTYGLCRKCRAPIGFERLDVLPESPFCLDCQESLEA